MSAINININKYIYLFNYSLLTDNNIMNKKKLYLRKNDLGSKTCYYFPAYLGVVHFPTIYFTQSYLPEPENFFFGCLGYRIMTPIDKTPFMCRFFWHFTPFSIGLLYKDVTQSDCAQRRDVTVSSETFGCFRNVFGKLKIYTFITLINKLLLTKKFKKKFCMQKWPPNFIFWSLKKCANSQLWLHKMCFFHSFQMHTLYILHVWLNIGHKNQT